MLTIGIAGYDGGKMAELDSIDYLFVAPSASVHRIQEAQTTIYHVLWELRQAALDAPRGGRAEAAMKGQAAGRGRRQYLPRRRRLRRRGGQAAGRAGRAGLGRRSSTTASGGMHLAYDLADGYQTTILVDAAAARRRARHDLRDRAGPGGSADGRRRARWRPACCSTRHGMQPDVVFGMLGMLGAQAGQDPRRRLRARQRRLRHGTQRAGRRGRRRGGRGSCWNMVADAGQVRRAPTSHEGVSTCALAYPVR